MSFPKFVDSVKRFLTHYLDMSQDREEEAASIEAIRAGVEFKGSTILILVFAIFIASLGLNTNSAAVVSWRCRPNKKEMFYPVSPLPRR